MTIEKPDTTCLRVTPGPLPRSSCAARSRAKLLPAPSRLSPGAQRLAAQKKCPFLANGARRISAIISSIDEKRQASSTFGCISAFRTFIDSRGRKNRRQIRARAATSETESELRGYDAPQSTSCSQPHCASRNSGPARHGCRCARASELLYSSGLRLKNRVQECRDLDIDRNRPRFRQGRRTVVRCAPPRGRLPLRAANIKTGPLFINKSRRGFRRADLDDSETLRPYLNPHRA